MDARRKEILGMVLVLALLPGAVWGYVAVEARADAGVSAPAPPAAFTGAHAPVAACPVGNASVNATSAAA